MEGGNKAAAEMAAAAAKFGKGAGPKGLGLLAVGGALAYGISNAMFTGRYLIYRIYKFSKFLA